MRISDCSSELCSADLDGSTDDSGAFDGAVLRPGHAIRLVRGERNVGKAGVLNRGLAMTHDDIVVTIDGDSWVYRDALAKLVERYLADPPGTRAVAGSVPHGRASCRERGGKKGE